jgi:radical SAM enzyme (TIGR01210 family)
MYPASGTARDCFVLERRAPHVTPDAWRYQGLLIEDERTREGHISRVAAVFLTGRECPWHCVMCDLWRHTTPSDTPVGAIPAQLTAARQALQQQTQAVSQIKIYNAASFFDPRAVPESDYGAIAAQLAGIDRVIVESHPALVGPRVDRLLDALNRHGAGRTAPAQLEVAMGLETVHPEALEQLLKRMTLGMFARAAEALDRRSVALRVFVLISPPFIAREEQDQWLLRSVDFAFSSGATVVSLVPTRPGNGALETLRDAGQFQAPRLDDIERSVEAVHTHGFGAGRVFVDLWDLERFADCPRCFPERRARLHLINLAQRVTPRAPCPACGSNTAP